MVKPDSPNVYVWVTIDMLEVGMPYVFIILGAEEMVMCMLGLLLI